MPAPVIVVPLLKLWLCEKLIVLLLETWNEPVWVEMGVVLVSRERTPVPARFRVPVLLNVGEIICVSPRLFLVNVPPLLTVPPDP